MKKVKLILFDKRYFNQDQIVQFGNIKREYNSVVTLCDFPMTDCSMVKIIDLEKGGE